MENTVKRDRNLKKLVLNKQTLRSLNPADLAAARGGVRPKTSSGNSLHLGCTGTSNATVLC